MSEQETHKRKTWSSEETHNFLYCYFAHKDEFYHSRKKKFAYANVLKDMIAQGFTSSSTTAAALKGKMRTLLTAYKAAKNSGNTPSCIAPFMDAMEEIYADSPMLTLNNMDSTTNQTIHTDTSDEKSQISQQLQEWSESTDGEILPVLLIPKTEKVDTIEKMSEVKRKIWSKEETFGFLHCYYARKDEFLRSRKKKFGYANVLKDMISQGFTTPTTTPTALKNKMRSLLGLYKAALGNPNTIEATSSIAPFMSEMEKIFGKQIHVRNVPITTKTVYTDSSDDDDELKTSTQIEEIFGERPHYDSSDEDHPQTSSHFQQWHHPESLKEEELVPPTIHLSSLAALPNPDPLSNTTFGKRKSPQQIFYEKKLKLKREEMESKKLMREAKHAQREKFMRESLDALQNKWEKDHELDMKKLELLERLVKK